MKLRTPEFDIPVTLKFDLKPQLEVHRQPKVQVSITLKFVCQFLGLNGWFKWWGTSLAFWHFWDDFWHCQTHNVQFFFKFLADCTFAASWTSNDKDAWNNHRCGHKVHLSIYVLLRIRNKILEISMKSRVFSLPHDVGVNLGNKFDYYTALHIHY